MTNQSTDTLRSKILFAFFAFALGMALATLIHNQKKPTSPQNQGLFEYKGTTVTMRDLDPAIAIPLYAELRESKDKQLNLLENAALQLHIMREADTQNKDQGVVANELLSVDNPTESEVNAFWEANADRINKSFSEVRGEIKHYLTQQKSIERQQEIIQSLQESGDLAFFITLPESPVIKINSDGYPTKGNPAAGAHIVEFADYQCPHCKQAYETLKNIHQKWGDKIKTTYMDFPVNRSGISRVVAEGAVCADQQGKFWEYHDKAFENQTTLTKGWPKQAAAQLGLDTDLFTQCLSSSETANKVKNAEQQALTAGVRGTPALFVNGIRVTGRDLEEALNKAIAVALGQ